MNEIEGYHRVRVCIGTVGVTSLYVRVPKGVGEATFESWLRDEKRWLESEGGYKIRARSIVAYAFVGTVEP